MTVHFVYIWYDRLRKMFYIGQHSGKIDDNYISSSRWLSSEVRYRPHDFRRKIIKTFETKHDAQKYEGFLLTLIEDCQFGKKYYNMRSGREKGITPWNKGKKDVFSKESIEKMSNSQKGKPNYWKGRSNPQAAINGRMSASKVSKTVTGRKRKYLPDGKWIWEYPTTSVTEQVGTISESLD